MKVYHKLGKKALDVLLTRGYLNGDIRHSTEVKHSNDKIAYDYIVEQMLKRNIVRDKWSAKYPVWLWLVWNGKKTKPRLQKWNFKWAKPNYVEYMVSLEIPVNKILASCYDRFHGVLNKGHIAYNEQESEQFKKLSNQKLIESKIVVAGCEKYHHPAYVQTLKDISWSRIFDVTGETPKGWDTSWIGTYPSTWVQGCTWSITKDMINHIWEYTVTDNKGSFTERRIK